MRPGPAPGAFLARIPALVIEILSPSTARRDRGEKKKIYERNGVEEYWIVSPESRHVLVYRLERGGYSKGLHVARGSVESSVLVGFEISLADIFAKYE